MKRGKKYQDAAKLVEKTKAYDTEEAVELARRQLWLNSMKPSKHISDSV